MTEASGTAVLEAEIPSRLLEEMRSLVEAGWFKDVNEILTDAVRRFVDTHRPELLDELAREDVEWGLRGRD